MELDELRALLAQHNASLKVRKRSFRKKRVPVPDEELNTYLEARRTIPTGRSGGRSVRVYLCSLSRLPDITPEDIRAKLEQLPERLPYVQIAVPEHQLALLQHVLEHAQASSDDHFSVIQPILEQIAGFQQAVSEQRNRGGSTET